MKRRTFLQSLLALPVVSALFGEAKLPMFANPDIPSFGEAITITTPLEMPPQNTLTGLRPNTTYWFRTREGEPIEVSTDWSEWREYDPTTGEIIRNG